MQKSMDLGYERLAMLQAKPMIWDGAKVFTHIRNDIVKDNNHLMDSQV